MSRLFLLFRRSLLPAGVAIALSLGAGQANAVSALPECLPGTEGLCPGSQFLCDKACLLAGGFHGFCSGVDPDCCVCLF